MGGHDAGQRAAEEDAGQDPGEDHPHRGASPFRRGEMGGERHDLLCHGRCEADQQGRGDQRGGARRQRREGEGEGEDRELADDQSPPFHDVSQGDQQEEAGGVAELRRRRDQARERARQVLLDQAEHRLVVIDVGDGDAGGCRHREGQRRAETGFPGGIWMGGHGCCSRCRPAVARPWRWLSTARLQHGAAPSAALADGALSARMRRDLPPTPMRR